MTELNAERSTIDQPDDEAAVRLLRLAIPRPPVPQDRMARVRAAVETEWRAASRRRIVRRQLASAAVLVAAAAVLVIAVGRIYVARQPAVVPLGESVAAVERIDGRPRRAADVSDQRETVAVLALSDPIRIGQWIETDAGSRVSLRFFDGDSVRLDVGSRLRLLSSTVVELSAGAVYVDSGRESGQFEVRTPWATARDVGTQFEVRLLDRALRLRVRSGMVELSNGEQSVAGQEGTEVLFSTTEVVSRPVSVYGSEWEWTARVSPPLDIDGVPLSVFLERLADEHGWTVRYADSALAGEASGIILDGSVNGLSPAQALDVVITSSGLRHVLAHGELMVLRAAETR